MIANHAWAGIAAVAIWFVASIAMTFLIISVHERRERRRQRSERRAALAPVFMLRPPTSYDAHSRDVARALHVVSGGRS